MVAELRSHMPQGADKNKNVVGVLPSACQRVKPTGRKADWRSEWMWVYMCVCVCVWERDRQTDNDRGRQGGTERHGWRYLWKDLCEGSLSWEAIPQKNEWLGRVKYERRQKQSEGVLFSCSLLWPTDSGSHWALPWSHTEHPRTAQKWEKLT